MAFGRRRSSKGMVIDATKHELRFSQLLEAGAVLREIPIALGKNTQDIADPLTDVKTGSLIKAIFFELNFNFEGNVTQVLDWAFVKLHQGQSIAELDPSIGGQPARSQRFLWGMEMPAGINNSSAVKRIGTLLIPKGKQRMSESDKWTFLYRSSSSALIDVCGHFIYKEYR